jgi:hypothetical protein
MRIVRIYGKDNSEEEGGSDCTECWIDLAIIDRISFDSYIRNPITGQSHYQRTTHHFNYQEDDNNSTRDNTKKRVINPEDESQWIEVPIAFRIITEASSGVDYQKTRHWYDNTAENENREWHKKRVIHNNIDEEFLDADDKPPSDPTEYLNAVIASADQDEDQYIDVAAIDRIFTERGSGIDYQGRRMTLAWEDYPIMAEPLVPIE